MSTKKMDLNPLLRFMETLPKSGDVELTLLKCHLLIEEVLTSIIAEGFNNPQYVGQANLSFSQKIQLARASAELSHAIWIWPALKLLNRARNELSHNLTRDEIEERLEKFIVYVKSHNKQMPKKDVGAKFSPFHWAVFATYSVVANHARFESADRADLGK